MERFGLWRQGREGDPATSSGQELDVGIIGNRLVKLLQSCCHLTLLPLDKEVDVLWLVQGFVVRAAFALKVLGQVFIRVAEAVRMLNPYPFAADCF